MELENKRTALLELEERYLPLMRNHTQLEKQYNNVRKDLNNLLDAHDKTLEDFNKLKVTISRGFYFALPYDALEKKFFLLLIL